MERGEAGGVAIAVRKRLQGPRLGTSHAADALKSTGRWCMAAANMGNGGPTFKLHCVYGFSGARAQRALM